MEITRCYITVVVSMLLLVTLMMILIFNLFTCAAKILKFKSVTNSNMMKNYFFGIITS